MITTHNGHRVNYRRVSRHDNSTSGCTGCNQRDWGNVPRRIGKLRVGLLSPCWTIGGVERWWMSLAKYAQQVDFIGVGLTGISLLHDEAVNEAARSMWLTTRLRTFIEECDVLLTWGDVQPFKINKPALFVIHGEADWTRKRREAWSHLPAVSVSTAAANSIDPAAKVICNGVDVARLSGEGSPRGTSRFLWDVLPDEKLLLYVGRFSQEKRPLLTAEVAARLSGVRSVYCCPNNGNDWRSEVRNVDPSAIFANDTMVNDQFIGDVYRACDAVLHGSESEGFCLALSEALWTGLPVIAERIGLFHEPQLQSIGYHPKFGDWPSAVEHALASHTQQRREHQMQVMQQFTAEQMTANWEQHLIQFHKDSTNHGGTEFTEKITP